MAYFTFWMCCAYHQQSSFICQGREYVTLFSATDYAVVYGSEFIFIRYFKALLFRSGKYASLKALKFEISKMNIIWLKLITNAKQNFWWWEHWQKQKLNLGICVLPLPKQRLWKSSPEVQSFWRHACSLGTYGCTINNFNTVLLGCNLDLTCKEKNT